MLVALSKKSAVNMLFARADECRIGGFTERLIGQDDAFSWTE